MTSPRFTSTVVAPTEAAQFASYIDWPKTILLLAVACVLLLAGGLAMGYWFAHATAPRSASMWPVEPSVTPAGDAVGVQRAALIAGFLRLRGLLDDQVSIGVVDDTLTACGVELSDPIGRRLDPSRHRVTGTVAAPDADADGVIARTTAPGFVDAGRVLRPADVIVYKWSRS